MVFVLRKKLFGQNVFLLKNNFMLQELSIKNFAIIDDLQIEFSDGLTILSGETGAGKSVIINAVNLLLGSKASAKLIRTGSETAELEALFHVLPESKVYGTIKGYGYDASEELLIRRVISTSNRHRIYINGSLATIQALKSITENLASISGQHAHQGLLKEEQHLLILDQFGGLMQLRSEVYKCFHQLIPLVEKLKNFTAIKNRQSEHVELLKFQQKEIVKASIAHREDMALEQEILRLKNGELLYQTVHDIIEEFYSSKGAIIERLVEAKKRLEKACLIDPELSPKAENIIDATFKIEEVVEELGIYQKNIRIDKNRLEDAQTRLDTLQRLKRKYGGSLESVHVHLETIDRELSRIENISGKIEETEARLLKLHDKLAGLAVKLSIKRKQAAEILSKKIEKELATLQMSQTKFHVLLQPIPASAQTDNILTTESRAITETGIDRAIFMIAPNIGETVKALSAIASGGELSRVVLALKAILAKTESVETVVFDEVDAGIGGSTAEVVGKKLSSLARRHQIICITHLPQIAKFGEHHFRISKHVSHGRTWTTIKPVNEKERINEIARMLGGEKITQATLNHAREMLKKT